MFEVDNETARRKFLEAMVNPSTPRPRVSLESAWRGRQSASQCTVPLNQAFCTLSGAQMEGDNLHPKPLALTPKP